MKSVGLDFKWIQCILLVFIHGMIWGQGKSIQLGQQNDVSLIGSQINGSINNQAIYFVRSVYQEITDVNRYVQILKDANHQLRVEDLGKHEINEWFKPLYSDSINCMKCVYWGRIAFKNETKSRLDNWILYFGKASKMDVYIFNENDSLVSIHKTGKLVPSNQKNLITGNRLARIPVSFAQNELLNVYFRIENINGYLPDLDIKLGSEDFYKSREFNRQGILDGLFIGFLLSILIFNLIFFFTTKDVTFLYQFIFVFSVLVFMLDIMNIICDFPFLRDYPKLLEPINFASIVLLNISYLQFVNKFIQLDRVFPNWINMINKLVQINLSSGAIIIIYYFISLNEQITDIAIAIISAVQYAFLLILLIQLFRFRNKKSYFILMATFFLIGGVIVNGVCVAFGLSVSIRFSMFVVIGNVSFFFFGLAYRMKLLKEEEHEAMRLKENQELKNRLYANITHEFRTPLTVIQGMVQQLENATKIKESSKLDQAIQLIKSNGNRLLKLVNTILDLAKFESGSMKLIISRGDIVSFLRYSVQLFESYANTKKIYLQFLTELNELEMDFDKEKMQQITSNLISNAIKFTPQGGKIYFSIKKIEKSSNAILQIEVKDSGEGIPRMELGNVFNRFFQVEGSKHKSQGSGLGLALVYESVKLMEGQIEVESELGKGTIFRIELPINSRFIQSINTSENSSKIEEVPHADDLYSSAIYSDAYSDKKTVADNEQIIRHAKYIESEKPLLLIVDDNKDIIYYLQTLLENQYTLETAYNGQEGIVLAQEIIPDIIISDVLMPDKDGYELCEILKNDERTSHIPIILLTAKAETSSRITGIAKGADAYLAKPFDELELKVQLENLLKIRNSLQEHYKYLMNETDSKEPSNPIEDAFLIKLNGIIRGNMEDEGFGILQLCRAMQMSRTQLHRKISALTGKSTSIYIRSLRLEKSKQLLRKPEMNISEVAFAVGFSDPNYFTRTFTEEFGITPSGFRSGS